MGHGLTQRSEDPTGPLGKGLVFLMRFGGALALAWLIIDFVVGAFGWSIGVDGITTTAGEVQALRRSVSTAGIRVDTLATQGRGPGQAHGRRSRVAPRRGERAPPAGDPAPRGAVPVPLLRQPAGGRRGGRPLHRPPPASGRPRAMTQQLRTLLLLAVVLAAVLPSPATAAVARAWTGMPGRRPGTRPWASSGRRGSGRSSSSGRWRRRRCISWTPPSWRRPASAARRNDSGRPGTRSGSPSSSPPTAPPGRSRSASASRRPRRSGARSPPTPSHSRRSQNVAQANGNRALLAEDRVGQLEQLLRTAPGERGLPKWLTTVVGCAAGVAAGRWAGGLEGTDLITACTAGGLGVTLALPTR